MATTKFFDLGATVSLKAGGPVMTVHSQPDPEAKSRLGMDRSYICQWFAGKKLERGHFRHEELQAALPQPLHAITQDADQK